MIKCSDNNSKNILVTLLYLWKYFVACVISILSKVANAVNCWVWPRSNAETTPAAVAKPLDSTYLDSFTKQSVYPTRSDRLYTAFTKTTSTHLNRSAAVRYRLPVRGSKQRQYMAESPVGVGMNTTDLLLRQQKEFHKLAFDYLSQALEIDESTSDVTQKVMAIELYRKGIKELESGVKVVICGQGEQVERAQRLRDKMVHSLQQTAERVEDLEEQMKTSGAAYSVVGNNGESVSSAHGVKRKPDVISGKTKSGVQPSSQFVGITQRGRVQMPRQQPLKLPVASGSGNMSQKPAGVTERPLSAGILKNVDSKLANVILNEIFDAGSGVTFADVAGQQAAKQALQEIVILPSLRPELFTGLRAPARGLLLFGPPGNGKTMLAKAVAHESSAKFFCISAASLTSKWVGEGEKMVRALFAVAKELQPSIIFMDEVDSLLCERREGEQEASRRIKTQFLLEFDGVQSSADDRILVMGATNRPFELDDAVLRRFPKRIYVQMPDCDARIALLAKLLSKHNNPLSLREIAQIARQTEGYSASDLTALAKDAALGPIRDLDVNLVKSVDVNKVRKITVHDFFDSLQRIRCSVPDELLQRLIHWSHQFGDIST